MIHSLCPLYFLMKKMYNDKKSNMTFMKIQNLSIAHLTFLITVRCQTFATLILSRSWCIFIIIRYLKAHRTHFMLQNLRKPLCNNPMHTKKHFNHHYPNAYHHIYQTWSSSLITLMSVNNVKICIQIKSICFIYILALYNYTGLGKTISFNSVRRHNDAPLAIYIISTRFTIFP